MLSAGFFRGNPGDTAGASPRRPVLRGTVAVALLVCVGPMLASCNAPPSAKLESIDQVDLTAKTPRKVTSRGEGPVLKGGAKQARYEMFPASGTAPLQDGEEPGPGVGEQGDGTFTVNVDQAPLPDAAKLILGETLGYNYVVDPRVQGSVTLVSNRPLTSRELLNTFEAALRLAGAALIQADGSFKIVALQEVLDGEMGQADLGKNVSAGYGVSAIPLRHIGAPTLLELMDSFIARSGSVRASKIGNLILIRGPAEERKSLVDVALSFDVDWMKTQSASIVILENGRPDDVASKLEAVFAEDNAAAGPNSLKIVPVSRINGLILIANSPQKVRRAMSWVKRLDQQSITDPNYYVYAVQNGNALELSRILSATFGTGGADAGTTADVAPDKEIVDVTMSSGATADQPAGTDPSQQKTSLPEDNTVVTGSTGNDASASFSTTAGTRITPNPANNTIVIRATPQEYRKILATLRQIDQPATQVLINTTIAEVALTNDLRYGVQAYFSNGNVGGGFFSDKTTQSSLTLKPTFPGMNFFVGKIADPQLVIDALSGVTKVRVVSSPSVLVLENETATIKVGDQVPVQSQKLVTDGGNVTNSFEYRDTGVILKVKPRVNANGLVTIELGQELSSVTPQSGASAGNNPTFSQRSINSKVSVSDQQTVLLGGLISGRENQVRDTVPGAEKVPLLGDLVGNTEKGAKRTELIVFITPKIIRNGEEAARESQELRDKMKNLTFN